MGRGLKVAGKRVTGKARKSETGIVRCLTSIAQPQHSTFPTWNKFYPPVFLLRKNGLSAGQRCAHKPRNRHVGAGFKPALVGANLPSPLAGEGAPKGRVREGTGAPHFPLSHLSHQGRGRGGCNCAPSLQKPLSGSWDELCISRWRKLSGVHMH
jgi:hypothetical protein